MARHDESPEKKPAGDFSFLVKFIFGVVFGGIVGAFLFFKLGTHLPDSWLSSSSPKYFIGIVLVSAVVMGLASGFLSGRKWWKR